MVWLLWPPANLEGDFLFLLEPDLALFLSCLPEFDVLPDLDESSLSEEESELLSVDSEVLSSLADLFYFDFFFFSLESESFELDESSGEEFPLFVRFMLCFLLLVESSLE